ncbi:MAG: carboxylesterase/lipase family protein [Halobacteriaceae archaeon]
METVVTTHAGDVRGRVTDGVHAFQGVPFAAPPYGDDRFRPPRPVEPWDGVRDAVEYGPKSPQPTYPPEVRIILPELVGAGEDCLTLNVWTPDPEATDLPVMVWISGGMYEFHGTSASPWYDGSRFARDEVVCVTISYRVGADGFLYLDDGVANVGLLDQVSALEWVRENVAAFGGDPENVTIFGESAGAMSVATLLATPRAEGLFHRAVAQSGAAQAVMSPESGLRVARRLADHLGVDATRAAIAAAPVDRVLEAQSAVRSDLSADPDPGAWGGELVTSMLPWQPVVDGDVLPGPPLERVRDGAAADVDLLVGTNTDEHRLFLVVGGALDQVTEDALEGVVAAYGAPVGETLAAYREDAPDASPGDVLAAVQTDWYWRVPAVRLADAHAASGGTTYSYEFAWPSPQYDGRLGACHALEIPFVFDTLGEETDALWGERPPQSLADAMHADWIEFASSGDPGWPTHDANRRATMHYGRSNRVVEDPLAATLSVWEGVR